jgi:chromosome segregation ATPase
MESTEESAIVKEAVEQLEAALERFTLTSPIVMPQSKPRSIYDLKEKVNDDDTRMSSLPVEMPLSTKLSLEANMNEIKTWAMLVKRETLKIKQINQEEITTTTTTNMLTKSDDATSNADKELIGKLQAEIEAYKDREKKYVNQITNIVDQNEQFQLIADEFEKIFKQFVVEKDANEAKLRKEIVDLTKERDHLQEDVVGIEQSFDNLHKRFENLKSKVNVFKNVIFSLSIFNHIYLSVYYLHLVIE